MTAPTLPRPMSQAARTALKGRIARLSMAIDAYDNAPKVIINGEVVDTTEVKRRVKNLSDLRQYLSKQLAARPWENWGREQSAAAEAE